MKLVIAGSRRGVSYKDVEQAYREAVVQFCAEATEIISGTATGADRFGEQLATALGIPLKRMPAEWAKHGQAAGFIRNESMAKYADNVLVVWNGYSKGSQHMIKVTKKYQKPLLVVDLDRMPE